MVCLDKAAHCSFWSRGQKLDWVVGGLRVLWDGRWEILSVWGPGKGTREKLILWYVEGV